MSSNKTFSFCIPTYNSGKTLGHTLNSIKRQTVPKSQFEVLIIDGGSTDNTLEIAEKYDFVTVLKNPDRLPEYAKSIAIQKATGDYLVFMDSDEAFSSNKALAMRKNAFRSNPDVHIILADKLNYVKGYGVCGTYLNKCGDPFSWFMYRQKNGILETFDKNKVKCKYKSYLLEFTENGKKPIADGGTTTVDMNYIRKEWADEMGQIDFACSVSEKILDSTNKCICIADDNVLHRSRSTLKSYLKKIKFRVINNIFAKESSGFSTRKISKRKKKYLFPLYSISTLPALIDGIYLSVKYRTPVMLLHPVLCWYTTGCIAACMLLKLLKKEKKNERY